MTRMHALNIIIYGYAIGIIVAVAELIWAIWGMA